MFIKESKYFIFRSDGLLFKECNYSFIEDQGYLVDVSELSFL